jgi:hypothetical protein
VRVSGSNASKVGLVQAEAPQSKRTGMKGVVIKPLKMEKREVVDNLDLNS